MDRKIRELSVEETMRRYPLITAHIIAESLGYAPPSRAARILKDAREGRKNTANGLMLAMAATLSEPSRIP